MGANIGIGTVGPKRRQSCALAHNELPKIDLVLLSHAHMDHLDIPSLNSLPGAPKAVTAYRTNDLLAETPIKESTELKWGEKAVIKTRHGDVEVEAFRVRHWGARWRHDTYRGYNGYIVSRMGKKVIFGGDTAMCSGFKEIASKGPFEFACMPIGAYNPFITAHCNPEEAVQMANAAGAKYKSSPCTISLSASAVKPAQNLCTDWKVLWRKNVFSGRRAKPSSCQRDSRSE